MMPLSVWGSPRGQHCVDAPSFAMATSLAVLSVAVRPISEGVLAEATNYICNLINPFTYMCMPNSNANYYYLEWWIVHMCEDPQYHSSMTNDTASLCAVPLEN
jgi:hypothetical protein